MLISFVEALFFLFGRKRKSVKAFFPFPFLHFSFILLWLLFGCIEAVVTIMLNKLLVKGIISHFSIFIFLSSLDFFASSTLTSVMFDFFPAFSIHWFSEFHVDLTSEHIHIHILYSQIFYASIFIVLRAICIGIIFNMGFKVTTFKIACCNFCIYQKNTILEIYRIWRYSEVGLTATGRLHRGLVYYVSKIICQSVFNGVK